MDGLKYGSPYFVRYICKSAVACASVFDFTCLGRTKNSFTYYLELCSCICAFLYRRMCLVHIQYVVGLINIQINTDYVNSNYLDYTRKTYYHTIVTSESELFGRPVLYFIEDQCVTQP